MYTEIHDGYDFSTRFDTFILAFCPDTDSWFATDQRFFYFEYPREFVSEHDAINYFKENRELFFNQEIMMGYGFRGNKIFLENTKELIYCDSK